MSVAHQTGPHTAHIEALTAEVRVLMVGSRQVTLSVFDQLDALRPEEIRPFGRVRPRHAQAGRVYVVGASARQRDPGVLVRSAIDDSEKLETEAALWRDLAGLLEILASVPGNDPYPGIAADPAVMDRWHARRKQRDDLGEKVWEKAGRLGVAVAGFSYEDVKRRGSGRVVDEFVDVAWCDAESGDARRGAAVARGWEDLPLIVLAGLR